MGRPAMVAGGFAQVAPPGQADVLPVVGSWVERWLSHPHACPSGLSFALCARAGQALARPVWGGWAGAGGGGHTVGS